MPLELYGVNHRTAPLAIREQLHYRAPEVEPALQRVAAAGIGGSVLLSTCNRTEFYLSEAGDRGAGVVREEWSARLGEPVERYVYARYDRDAVAHAFRVAAGMDSMLLGESQIQGQVREAWQQAHPTAGPVLHRLFQAALMVGGRVRGETALAEGAGSAASAAVELAKKIFGDLEGREALVLGAGEMSELALTHLTGQGVRAVVVANRRFDRASELARRVGARAVRFDDAWPLFAAADIVLCSTGAPHPVVRWEHVAPSVRGRRGRPLCLLDIAVPRDVEQAVGQLENVFLYDLDDLQTVVESTESRRREELPAAERIVLAEVDAFWEWLSGREVVPAIQEFRARIDDLREQEVQRALRRLQHLDEGDREAVEQLSRALMNKFAHAPMTRLRVAATNGAGGRMADALRYLFGLERKDRSA